MFNKFLKIFECFLVCVFFVLLLSSCSVSIEKPFPIPMLTSVKDLTSEIENPNPVSINTYAVKESVDGRSDKAFFKQNGEAFEVDAELGPMVREAFEIALSRQGFQFSPKGPAVFSLTIKKWSFEITKGFVNGAIAEAELGIELFTPSLKRTYQGVYSGRSEVSSFVMDNNKAKEVLSLAMAHAITQAVEDKGLMLAVASIR
ncbi:MAG TPA: YajG family lipoprotein [Oligoflexia bacterium]|nr:YajG family lipoprotein [Oligoflexia bacterium]HMP49913.1 YajG family lipoprotein [Oligoflexia bacterium]